MVNYFFPSHICQMNINIFILYISFYNPPLVSIWPRLLWIEIPWDLLDPVNNCRRPEREHSEKNLTRRDIHGQYFLFWYLMRFKVAI